MIVLIPYQPLVLCIDDDGVGLLVRKALLEHHGFSVLTAENGPIGLAIADREAVDAVVLDYEMPVMNGDLVACKLREKHVKVPILLLSGVVPIPDALLKMCDDFVTKGDDPQRMVDSVERLTGVRELVVLEPPKQPSSRSGIPPASLLRRIR